MRKIREAKGTVLSEFGPALGIFLIGFFFPVIDMCGLFSSYACCIVLNNVQCREASMLRAADAQDANGLIIKQLPEVWMKNGIGRFAAIKSMPATTVDFSGPKDMALVTVRTTCTVIPWLQIPLPVTVPGMNTPVSFSIQSTGPAESATDKD